jgi:hypothetical protein
MLTIKNINKIVGQKIVNEWYIKSMHGLVCVIDMNGLHKEVYQIVIWNKQSNSEGKIYLDRNYKNKEIKHWYELYCRKGNTETNQLVTKDNIKDVKELLEYIRIVALD